MPRSSPACSSGMAARATLKVLLVKAALLGVAPGGVMVRPEKSPDAASAVSCTRMTYSPTPSVNPPAAATVAPAGVVSMQPAAAMACTLASICVADCELIGRSQTLRLPPPAGKTICGLAVSANVPLLPPGAMTRSAIPPVSIVPGEMEAITGGSLASTVKPSTVVPKAPCGSSTSMA